MADAITLRRVWDELYLKDNMRAPNKFEVVLRRVENLMPVQPVIHEIDDDWLRTLRLKATEAEYAPSTINGTLSAVISLMRRVGPTSGWYELDFATCALVSACVLRLV